MAEKEIITTEKTSASGSQLGPASRSICLVCQKQFSQYTCPRCNTRYCSLHCYKSHSIRCTESFMRENVMDEFRQVRPDDESKKKMLDILKRFQSEEEDSMDDDDGDDDDEPGLSEETIQKVLSGDGINYDDLTLEEKKLFRRAMTSGELSKMIKPWDPWWLKPSARSIFLSQDGTQLIQPIVNQKETNSPQDNSESNLQSEIPSGPETALPPLKQLISTDPSPLLAIHLVDILYSYCFTLRLYNGDWQSDAGDAASVVLSISSVLGQGSHPETMLEAVSYCLQETCSPEYKHMGGLQFGFNLLDDVASLISLGGGPLVCALCDLRRMIQAAEKELKSEKRKGKAKKAEMKSKLKLAERKIYFIMCWVHEQMDEVWASLTQLVRVEKGSALEYHGPQGRPLKTKESESKKSKALIEELQ
ncbi:hypothetical protein V2J09_004874 [Rumex salicifolius]